MSNVNHPSHYNKQGRRECIDEMCDLFGIANTQIFCLENAYKYLYRAGEKEGNSKEQDLNKCKWYLDWAKNHGNESVVEKYDFVYKMYEKEGKNGDNLY